MGHFHKNGCTLESDEEATFKYLTLFGFDVECIKPAGAFKVKNPDVLVNGAIWEAKTPSSHNEQTIKNRFREAKEQATKIIFDLRFVEKQAEKVQAQVINMFKGDGRVRRLMVIEKSGEKILDFYK